ncbi:MAG: NAD(P)H-dependent oxidoreductase [Lachnospiraceae bacterium]|nr:NAD(P)H-dependent oxidoreductase [Lachnospiraceae bacterium]
MKTTIIYAHPWEDSFNNAVLKEAEKAAGDYKLIDLYADGFNPVMSKEELAVYSRGKFLDPLVAKYNRILDDTDRIIFIFPIWWYDMPAILRGFLDKVMLEGSAYTTGAAGLIPVRDISQTYIFTTSSTPTDVLMDTFGDPVHNAMISATFQIVGFQNAVWKNLGAIDASRPQERQEFLDEVRRMLEQ